MYSHNLMLHITHQFIHTYKLFAYEQEYQTHDVIFDGCHGSLIRSQYFMSVAEARGRRGGWGLYKRGLGVVHMCSVLNSLQHFDAPLGSLSIHSDLNKISTKEQNKNRPIQRGRIIKQSPHSTADPPFIPQWLKQNERYTQLKHSVLMQIWLLGDQVVVLKRMAQ